MTFEMFEIAVSLVSFLVGAGFGYWAKRRADRKFIEGLQRELRLIRGMFGPPDAVIDGQLVDFKTGQKPGPRDDSQREAYLSAAAEQGPYRVVRSDLAGLFEVQGPGLSGKRRRTKEDATAEAARLNINKQLPAGSRIPASAT